MPAPDTDNEHVNMAHAREQHQRETMERIVQDDVCPFCREHFETYHTKPIIKEDGHWILTYNFAPYEGTLQHYLLVAKKHCIGFWELSNEAQLSFFSMLDEARKLAAAPGGTIVMRWGDTDHTGASVSHLHAQLVIGTSRKKNSKPILTALGYQATHE